MTGKRLRTAQALAISAIIWLTAVVAAYYILHKPFAPSAASALALAGRDLALGLLLLSLAGGLGRRLLPKAQTEPLAAMALQGALGLGCLSLGLLGAGVLGLLTRPVLWGAAALLGLWLRHDLWAWLRQIVAVRAALGQGGWLAVGIAVLAGIILAGSLAVAMAPPVHFDALVYHLVLPLDFLDAGSIRDAGSNPYWGMPFSTELLYTWAIALGRLETAAVLGWWIGALALLGVLGFGRTFGPRAGWAAVAALLCGETLAASLGWAYADWLVGLFGVALIIALDRWARAPNPGGAAIAGVVAGLALGVKYTAGFGWAAAGVAILTAVGLKRGWRSLLVFAGAACAAASPWFLKNLVYTGVPLYPFVGTNAWVTPFRQALYRGDAGGVGALAAAVMPIRATLFGVEGAPGPAASLGPLLLGLIPGLLLIRRAAVPRARRLLAFLVSGWVLWALGSVISVQLQQSRLYYVLYPAWAVLAGAGFAGLSRVRVGRVRLRRLAAALLLVVLTATAFGQSIGVIESGAVAAAVGADSAETYLVKRLGAYMPATQAVVDLGADARVLALWEARGLYCRRACLPDHWIDRWASDRHELRTADAILAAWLRQGYTHVLLYQAGAAYVRASDARYTTMDWEVLDQVLRLLRPVRTFGDGYTLYEVPR